MSSFTFSRVTIIQALSPNDFQSGNELSGYINGLREDFPELPTVDFVNTSNSDEFFQSIENLIVDCEQKDEHPILHIEIHGLLDKSGLSFPDDSTLKWKDLALPLARLNRATGFNLVVCVAACFGGHFLEAISPTDPSPCFALIGPTDLTDGSELLGSFRSFYRALLTKKDANAALADLHAHRLNEGGFLTSTAEDWFFKLVQGYLEEKCTKERLAERFRSIQETQQAEGKVLTPMGANMAFQMGKTLALTFLHRRFETFFMTRDIPSNSSRFSPSFEEANRRALQFFVSQGY